MDDDFDTSVSIDSESSATDDGELFPVTFNTQSSHRDIPTIHLSPSQSSSSHMISPLKKDKVAEVKQRKQDAEMSAKTIQQAESTIKRIVEMQDLESKSSSYINDGGIMGIAGRCISNEPVHHQSRSSHGFVIPSSVKKSTTKSCPSLPIQPPGLLIFTKPPVLIDTIFVPASIVDEFSSFSMSTLMEDLILGDWLSFKYCCKPCPIFVLHWLVEVSCLSNNITIRRRAFEALNSLIPNALNVVQDPQKVLSIELVISILVKLGANPDHLKSFMLSENETHAHESCNFVLESLQNLLKLIATVNSICPYSFEDIKNLTSLCIKVSLDTKAYSSKIFGECSACLNNLVSQLTMKEQDLLAIFLANSAITDNIHHHNQLHIVELFATSVPKLRNLQRLLLREFLRIVDTRQIHSKGRSIDTSDILQLENASSSKLLPVQDHTIADNVVSYYSTISLEDIDYYQFHSVAVMLTIFISTHTRWPNPQSMQNFISSLSHLCSVKIQDSVHEPLRGPVKDVLIRLRMDLQSHCCTNDLQQKDLFNYFVR